jgi:hypothetical protein
LIVPSSSVGTDEAERVILGMLLERYPAPTTMAELARIVPEIAAQDGVAALYRDGLAHREGDAVWPTRAAVRGDQLAL